MQYEDGIRALCVQRAVSFVGYFDVPEGHAAIEQQQWKTGGPCFEGERSSGYRRHDRRSSEKQLNLHDNTLGACRLGDGAAEAMTNRYHRNMDPLLAWRKEFPILARTTYMVSHSLGAMPRRTAERLQEFADTWASRGVRAWEEGWWEMPVTTGDLIGSIIGAGQGEIVMQQNVSICQWIVTSCFTWNGPRNKLVTDALNFPSNGYIYYELERQGARIVSVPSPDGMTLPLELILEAIDEQTQLVSVSHVAFRSSYVQDLAAITKRAHEVGALVVADIYQSAGTLPINVRELGVDFATGGSVKWLCGGPGAGYLYVRRDLWPRLKPAATGWMAHREPFHFDAGPVEFADNAFRFLNGTPSIPGLVFRALRVRDRSRDRRRAHSRKIHAPDPAAHRACERSRLPRAQPSRSEAAGRNSGCGRAKWRRGHAGTGSARSAGRLPAAGWNPNCSALLLQLTMNSTILSPRCEWPLRRLLLFNSLNGNRGGNMCA